MSDEDPKIVNRLFQQYYVKNQTPESLVSSYWKDMHKKSEVLEDGMDFDLRGVGFGDFEFNGLHHKLMAWLSISTYLMRLKNAKEVRDMIEVAKPLLSRFGFPLTYDAFRFICTLTLIKEYASTQQRLRVLNIGDGYGFLSNLIKEVFPDAQMCMVDLGKTLLFQANYAYKANPAKKHFLITEDTLSSELAEDMDFIFCPAEHLEKLDGLDFNLAINIASMEEMNEETVQRYFAFLRSNMTKDNLFYCCNREEKIMEGGEVSRIGDYPWAEQDVFLVDELCPWHKYFFATHPAQNGPKIAGMRVPFINYFDGSHRHRLAVMKTL